ncbi:MAG TPA: PAS domain S-box protein, partial [Opitutales bacterium]|nr:PAS domain S-box protein [Opitutales bacterium]
MKFHQNGGNGRSVYCDGTVLKGKNGEKIGSVLRFRGTGAVGAVSEESELEVRRLRELADSVPVMLWMISSDGRLDYANDSFLEYTGISPEEPLTCQWWELVHEDDVEEHLRKWRETVREEKMFLIESRLRQAGDGEARWFQIKAVPIRDRNGKISQWNGTAVDIHDIKVLEAETSSLAKRLVGTLESITDGFYLLDPEWRFVYFNAAAEKLSGYKREEVLGKVLWEAFPNVVELPFFQKYRQVAQSRVSCKFEEFYPDLDKWYSVSVHPLDEGLAIYFQDITKQREVEEQIRASEERFRLFVKGTQDIIWDWNPVSGKLQWSENFDSFGYGPDYTDESDTLSNFIHPDDRESVSKSFRSAIESGQTEWSAEYRFRRKDGSYAFIVDRAYLVRDRDGKLLRVIGGLNDQTVQRMHEEKLREQAALLDIARDAIVVGDLEGKILYWNKSAERLYGWSAEEAIGDSIPRLLYRSDERAIDEFAQTVRTGESVGEAVHLKKDGKTVLVEGRWTLVSDEDGRPKSILLICTDITERKKLEQQVSRNQRLGSIGTLASVIAHDLNNIFAPIRIGIDMLLAETEEESVSKILRMMQTSTDRGADLVSQILTFARGVEKGEKVAQLKTVVDDVGAVIRDTFPKSIDFEFEVAEDLLPVQAEPTQIHQVLMNLCLNARDAMAKGGVLRVVARNVKQEELGGVEREACADDYVLLEIGDSGVGIPPEIREEIFDPFFTTKEFGKGTGLGLSTALMIVKGYGGVINLQSELGRGTTFGVYLPVAQTTDQKEAGSQPVKAAKGETLRGKNECILLVDDESAIRQVTAQILTRFGYRVCTASNGAEAVDLYRKKGEGISLVLTDLAMPVMDG